jgi:hypothetical protein
MDSAGIFDKLESHAASLGIFEQVNTVEPKSPPGNGVTAALWLDSVGPARGSGLTSTDALLVFMLRIYSNPFAGPREAIDPAVLAAVDALITVYSGHLTLGGTVMQVDLLGRTGTSLRSQAGHVRLDNTIYRVVTLTVPVIVADTWPQAA